MPAIVNNSGRRHSQTEVFADGVGIFALSGGSVNVHVRDARVYFAQLGERIALEGKVSGDLIRNWRDERGRPWARYRIGEPGSTLVNSADVRFSDGGDETVREALSFVEGPRARSLISVARVEGDGENRRLTIIKFFPGGSPVSKLVLSKWRAEPGGIREAIARIPAGMMTFDHRIKERGPVRYPWPGRLPSKREVLAMAQAGAALDAGGSFPMTMNKMILAIGVFFIGIAVFLFLRHRLIRGRMGRARVAK